MSEKTDPFTGVPNFIFALIDEIGIDGIGMYAYLLMRSGEDGKCFPSYDRMQKDLKVSRYKVSEMIKRLEDVGLVQRKRRFSASTIYTVISSKIELMDAPLVQKSDYISSKIELPLVQKSDTNKNHFKKNHLNNTDEQDTSGMPFALLLDAFISYSKIPLFNPRPRDIEALTRMVENKVTPAVIEAAIKALGTKYKIVGPASIENACYSVMGEMERNPQDEVRIEGGGLYV